MKFESVRTINRNEIYEHGNWVLVEEDYDAFLFYNKNYDGISQGWGTTADEAVEDYVKNLNGQIAEIKDAITEAKTFIGNMETE